MAITLFHYENCDTCKKARKWLKNAGIEVTLRPIVQDPPHVRELRDLWTRSGLPLLKFFNTSGESYRALDREAFAATTDDEKLKLLSLDGKLIKRPILDDGTTVLVGFDATKYGEWRR